MGKNRYGVILDAGSSGSRVYVYRWKNAQDVRKKGDKEELARLPEIKTKKDWRKKVHPGVSTFGERPEAVGPEHLHDLVRFALDIVPKDEVERTPIFLLATAGMRLLPAHQRTAVLDHVCAYFQQNTKFLLPDCGLHVQMIPGETEGLYGWVAANYLLGGFDAPERHDHGKGHSTYGFLDMGGASAQIAFAPNVTETAKHANDLKFLRLRKVNGEALEYRVFVTTWLGFGANEARRRYLESLIETYSSREELPDPCLPVGLLVDQAGHKLDSDSTSPPKSKEPHLIGTGMFAECLKRTYPLLEKDVPCDDPPCLLSGVHTPAIDFDVNHFVGVSEYWHTTHEVFAMAHKDKAYDFHTYQKQVTDFCSRDWTDIEADVAHHKWGKKVDEKTVEEVCFKASWLISMLHDGIGVPRVGLEPISPPGDGWSNKTNEVLDKAKDRGFLDPFQAADEIHGTELSWTLGKMVLYASSQMPAADPSLAVGFGTNNAGATPPSDFQYAGGASDPLLTDSSESDAPDDWHDRILSSSYSRRIPGILIFLLILALASFLLCGRERRLALSHRLLAFLGRSPTPPRGKRRKGPGLLNGKFFGGSGSEPLYERLLDTAPALAFELGDLEDGRAASDSGASGIPDPPRSGRTSGWATPATRALSPDFTRGSPKGKGYFDAGGGAEAGVGAAPVGLGLTPFERGGLSVRTESKERLAPRDSAHSNKSRTGSPTAAAAAAAAAARRSPLIAPLNKESVD